MGSLLSKLLGTLHSKNLDIVIVGLDNSGKTTLLNVLSMGQPSETCPTIGLNVKMVKKNGVNMKCWDLGGQSMYRDQWSRYTRGCDGILFVVDTYARERLPEARKELHRLLEDRALATTPILICANKIDLEPHVDEAELIKELNLDYIMDNPWIVIPMSALKQLNIEAVIEWLIRQSK